MVLIKARRYLHDLKGSVRKRGLIATLKLLVPEIYFDFRYGTDTFKLIALNDLEDLGNAENRKFGVDYHGSNYLLLRKIFDRISREFISDCSSEVIVDFGSGKGRVLLTAATYGFEKMIGVEFSRTLCQIAEKNVTIFQKRTQAKGHFEIIHSDAIHFSIPAEATVFFFFNPFGESIMNQVLDNISGSLRAHPRRSLIVYLNPTLQQVFERVGITKVFTLTAPTGHEDAIIYSWGNG